MNIKKHGKILDEIAKNERYNNRDELLNDYRINILATWMPKHTPRELYRKIAKYYLRDTFKSLLRKL